MKSKYLITILSSVLPFPFISGATSKQQEPVGKKAKLPNVVFILADDMGIGDLGCYGQKIINTPNIDALAASGLQFTNHYSGSTVRAPSRCCLMTGMHTGHGYIRGNKPVKTDDGSFDLHLSDSEQTVAQLFKQRGYATMCVGKWGLGGPKTTGSPMNKGFDYFFGYLSQQQAHYYYPDFLFENDQKVMLDGKTYSHSLIMKKGIKYLKKQKKKPFFAYFSVTPPHADLDIPELGQYENAFTETPFVNNKYKNGSGYKSQPKPRAAYAAMVSEVDKNVGQIVELLKKMGVLENTLIIFSSDNGPHKEGGNDPDFFDSNSIYRGYKRDLYEGGVRTPLIVNWPKVITEKRTTNHTSAFWDFMPTVCDLIGVEKPKAIDGISYLPTLFNKEANQQKHDYLYFEFHENSGKQSILKDGWKLVRLNISNSEKTKEELYNLNTDIREENNVINEYPEIAGRLKVLMNNARTESNDFNWGK